MKNYKKLIKLLLAVVIGISSSTALHAQWGFTATFTVSGRDCGFMPPISIPINGMPTKSSCESLRSMILNFQVAAGVCRAYYKCTACTGSDIAGAQQSSITPGKVIINGTETGQATFSPNPGQSIQDWINDFQQKAQAFGPDNVGINEYLPTGNIAVDNNYGSLLNEGWTSSLYAAQEANQGFMESSTLGQGFRNFESVNLNRNSPELPPGPSRQQMENFYKQSQLQSEMERLAKELKRIEMFENSPYLKKYGEDYQERKKELEAKFQEVSDELKKIKTEKYADAATNKQEQELERKKAEYEQELSECQNQFCRNSVQTVIDDIEKQRLNAISSRLDAEKNLKEVDEEVRRKGENIKNNSEIKMSYAEQQCEIAGELKYRGDNVSSMILYAEYGTIVKTKNTYNYVSNKAEAIWNSTEDFRRKTADVIVDGANFTVDAISLFSADNGTVKDGVKGITKAITGDVFRRVGSDGIKNTFGTGNNNIAENAITNTLTSLGEKIPIVGKVFQGYNTYESGMKFSKSIKEWWN